MSVYEKPSLMFNEGYWDFAGLVTKEDPLRHAVRATKHPMGAPSEARGKRVFFINLR